MKGDTRPAAQRHWEAKIKEHAQNLEAKTNEYATCVHCNEKSVLADQEVLFERATCYNPKCKNYESPKALIDVPFALAIPFLQNCIATGPSGFYGKYITGIIRLTKKAEEKYG